jgi:hypothetical protein
MEFEDCLCTKEGSLFASSGNIVPLLTLQPHLVGR